MSGGEALLLNSVTVTSLSLNRYDDGAGAKERPEPAGGQMSIKRMQKYAELLDPKNQPLIL